MVPICDRPMSVQTALEEAFPLVVAAAERIGRILESGAASQRATTYIKCSVRKCQVGMGSRDAGGELTDDGEEVVEVERLADDSHGADELPSSFALALE